MLRKIVFTISSLMFIGLPAFAEEPTFHKVQEGETFYRIAVQTFPENISTKPDSVEKLKALNPGIPDVTKIRVGQKIIVSGTVAEIAESKENTEQKATEQINENKVDLINEPQVRKVLSEEDVERQISSEEK